jgi:hypothetical protein
MKVLYSDELNWNGSAGTGAVKATADNTVKTMQYAVGGEPVTSKSRCQKYMDEEDRIQKLRGFTWLLLLVASAMLVYKTFTRL